jgi:hypothetical protein
VGSISAPSLQVNTFYPTKIVEIPDFPNLVLIALREVGLMIYDIQQMKVGYTLDLSSYMTSEDRNNLGFFDVYGIIIHKRHEIHVISNIGILMIKLNHSFKELAELQETEKAVDFKSSCLINSIQKLKNNYMHKEFTDLFVSNDKGYVVMMKSEISPGVFSFYLRCISFYAD